MQNVTLTDSPAIIGYPVANVGRPLDKLKQAARREEHSRQETRVALAVQGESIARSALTSIAAGKSSPCEVAREALRELDDVGARRQMLQDEEQEANSRALRETALRHATSLAAQKAAMRMQLRHELRIKLLQ